MNSIPTFLTLLAKCAKKQLIIKRKVMSGMAQQVFGDPVESADSGFKKIVLSCICLLRNRRLRAGNRQKSEKTPHGEI